MAAPHGRVATPPAALRSWRAVAHFLRSPATLAAGVTHDLVTTLFPGNCQICDAALTRASTLPVCFGCLTTLEPRPDPGCRRCGDHLPLADLEDLRFLGMECLACRMAPPPFERAVSFGDYEDTLCELIHLLKYQSMPGLARRLGQLLANAIGTLQPEAGRSLLVVAVPLFARAERTRGYNQARLLADHALRSLACTAPGWHLQPAHGLLVRKKSTAQQFELSARARRRNLEGAFALPPGAAAQVKGREVLLIDDILTTGATARECARVLRRAGAGRVWVATLARACGNDWPGRRPRAEDTVARWGSPGD